MSKIKVTFRERGKDGKTTASEKTFNIGEEIVLGKVIKIDANTPAELLKKGGKARVKVDAILEVVD